MRVLLSTILISAFVICGAPGSRAAVEGELPAPAEAGDEAAEILESTESIPLALDPVTVIRLTVKLSPQIKRSSERKAAEEARFDFFINNRQAFSYGVGVDFQYDRSSLGADRELEKSVEPAT